MDAPDIVNIMADGQGCESLTAYLEKHALPETALRVLEEVICGGELTETTEKGRG